MVEQQLDAFARRQLAAAMLRVDAPLAAAHAGAFATFFEDFENMFHGELSEISGLTEFSARV